MEELTQEELKRTLHYNPDTGVFTNKIARGPLKVGDIAGTKSLHTTNSNGKTGEQMAITIRINGKRYLAQRLAWLYMIGEWGDLIRHINNDKFDNRWKNLKNYNVEAELKRTCPHRYIKDTSSNNTSGFRGVYWNKQQQKWKVQIMVDGKSKFLGYFKDFDDAVEARKKAELKTI